jgi:hypothetical protein
LIFGREVFTVPSVRVELSALSAALRVFLSLALRSESFSSFRSVRFSSSSSARLSSARGN